MSISRFSFIVCLLSLCLPALSAPVYTVHVLGASGTPSTAVGINQSGDVAGQSGVDAWMWHAGATRFIEDPLLGSPGYRVKQWLALGVDSGGNLEAFSEDVDSVIEPVRLDGSGLHTLSSRSLGFVSQELHPTASGPAGQIVGWYLFPGSGPTITAGFVSQGASLVSISPPGWTSLFPRAVNSLGWIAGDGTHNGRQAGFLLRSGNISDLGAVFPLLLNEAGNLAGRRTDGSLFVWVGNKTYTIAPLAGHTNLQPLGMNGRGEVVGVASGSNPADAIGFLWTPTGGTESLENAGRGASDFRVIAAHGVNDAGQIAADIQGISVASPHAAILSPLRSAPLGSHP